MSLALNFAAYSDRGLVRGNNEDSAFAGQRLLALADGMGGHAAGEVASQLVIASFAHLDNQPPGEQILDVLNEATEQGNYSIASAIAENPTQDGMGCTLTALLFDGNRVGLCHVGDSRAYRVRNGTLEQITKDDTFVQSLVDEGKLAEDDVSSHPQRSLILKALTGHPVVPTLATLDIQEGDRYLLCSDGLSDPVSRDTIGDILPHGTPDEVSRRLIEIALRGGGPDNITVVVADVVDSSHPGLPHKPIVVGAANMEAPELPRPDTAAGRAAQISESSTDGASDVEGKSGSKKLRWIALTLLLILILGGVGAFVLNNRIKDTYYVAEDNSQISIYQGYPDSILGINLSTKFQDICLLDSGQVRTLETHSSDDCHRFSVSDLTPSAQGNLEDLPKDDYNAILQQVQRLSEETLPPCVTRISEPADKENNVQENNPDSHKASQETRSEDHVTPGVSCREVKD